jgi:fibronectin-binding autotransporter adhesin
VAGGTMNIGAATNTTVNNDIEYAAAGLPSIMISGGTLNVYGSVRRATTTLAGALVYNQSGGTVTVAGSASTAAPANTRGIFEIENNTGSVFNLTGNALLQIQRTKNNPGSFADLYVNPSSSSVSPTSTIEMGLASTAQAMSYNVAVPIGNFTIVAGGTNAQSVTMYSNPMIASGDVTINAYRTLNTNSLDVFVGGNLTIVTNGVYNGANNTTTFNGPSGLQTGTLSSGSSFLNMTVNKASGTVTLLGTAPTLNNLNILSGTLDVGSMSLAVNRDITNNSFQIGSGNITLAGAATAHSIYSNNGSFTNLTLGGTANKVVTVTGNMSIQGTLDFAALNRYLYIRSSRLTFGAAGAVTGAISNATGSSFIRTNGVSSDLGVVKVWTAGANKSFTYAVGTRFNYTPVSITLDNITTGGSYTIIPVDDQHPTADAMGEYILNYYWIGIKDASLAFDATGTHTYRYPKGLIGGANSAAIYTGAYLDALNLIGWTVSPPTATFPDAPGDANSSVMTFNGSLNASMPPNGGGEFHYTAGTPGDNHTLPNPIRPVYSRFSDADDTNPTTVGTSGGNWNLATNWTLDDEGKGPGLSVVPVGRPIVILEGAKMYMNIAGLRAFRSVIDGTMIVTNKTTFTPTSGHNLGNISGTGTLQVKSSTLPAGNYTTFVSAAGGTIEYDGTTTMNNRAEYNNVSIIGGGVVTMTNTDLVLNGNMTIATGSKLDNSANNRNMTVAKNFTVTGTGTFDPGTGSVAFNSTANTVITGPSSTFYGLEVAKTGTGTVSSVGGVMVNGNLTMTSGTYTSTNANLLTVSATGTTSGGSSASFVTGPMRKELLAGGGFDFPVGTTAGSSRYRHAGIYNTDADAFWTILYVGNNPTTDGYSNKAFNTDNIKKVSMFEYWLVSRDNTAKGDLELSYSTGSYIPNVTNVGTMANLRVVHWDAGQSRWDLPSGGGTFSQGGTNVTGTVRVTGVDDFSPFSLGSLDFDSPLPVKWGPVEAVRSGRNIEVKWVTLQEIDNDHFVIERSEDGVTFIPVGDEPGSGTTSMKQTYRFTDNTASMARRYYYRIRQVDYNGLSDYSPLAVVLAADGGEMQLSWLAYPNPLVKDVEFVLYRSDNTAPDQVRVMLYSAQGVLLYQGSGSLKDMNTSVNKYLQDARSGVYVLQVSDGTLAQGFKIVRP